MPQLLLQVLYYNLIIHTVLAATAAPYSKFHIDCLQKFFTRPKTNLDNASNTGDTKKREKST